MTPMLRTLARLAPLVGVRLIAVGLVFLQTVALTRVFGAEVFGLYSFAQTVVVVAALTATFGFDKLLMRRLAAIGLNQAAGDPGWGLTLRFCLRASGVAALILSGLGLALFGPADLGGAYGVPLIGAALALPLLVGRQFAEALLLGAKRTMRSIAGSQLAFPAVMIAGAATVAAFGLARDDGAITSIYVTAITVSAIVALAFMAPLAPRLRPGAHPAGPYTDVVTPRAVVASGASFGLVSAGFIIGPQMDVLLLGILSGPEDVAVLRVAARIAEMIGMVRAIVMLKYAPLLAEAHGQGDHARLRRLVRELGLIFIITGTPLFLGFSLFAEDAMGLFGPDFVHGAPVMRIYVIGVFFTMLAGPGSSLLSMCGHEGLSARMLWISLGVNLGLDLILIPLYGAVGCAIANMASLIVLGLGASVLSARKLSIHPSALVALFRRGAR